MTPATTVSHVTHDARMNGQRLVAPVISNDYPQNRPDNEAPIMPHIPAPRDVLLADETVKNLKAQNTQQLLKSNYWYEIANISRWCTTGLIGLTMFTIVNAAGWSAAAMPASIAEIGAGLGAAFFGAAAAPVWGALAVLAIAATFTVKASQHSRNLFVEKSFDVQDTLMQRQAKLVGKSVEEAVAPVTEQHGKPSWVSRTQTALEQAEPQHSVR